MTGQPQHGGNLVWAATVAGCEPESLLDFSASISPLGPPQSVLGAIQGAMGELSAYPNPDYPSLCEALGHHHSVPADWVLPGNGAAELLTWAGRDLATQQQTVVLGPSFGDYGRSLQAAGAHWLSLPLPGLAALRHPTTPKATLPPLALTAERGLLLNNPHNPTGLLFERAAIEPLLKTGALVVVDEAFMDFVAPDQQQSVIPWIADYDNLVVLRSLTKFYRLPGLRLGYALARPERLGRWRQWRDPWPVNVLAAAAAAAAVQDRGFQQQTWDWLPPARQALQAGLAALSGLRPWPGAANFLLVACDRSVTALQTQLLRQHRILIRDCLSFAELGDRSFRVAVRSPADNQRLLAALKAVLAEDFPAAPMETTRTSQPLHQPLHQPLQLLEIPPSP